MLSFISAKEAAEKWDISQRRVAILCAEQRISGAMMVGNMWIIPSNAEKPVDKRTLSKKGAINPKTRKFEITIEETVSKTFIVEANTKKKAIENAIEKYESGEFILEPGNLIAKQIAVLDSKNNTYTEWVEF